MRLKQFLPGCSIRAKASLVRSRITFSYLTIIYFLLAVIHCIVQVVFQARAFSINVDAADHLWSLLSHANQTGEAQGFAVLGNDLHICYQVPKTISTDSCPVIWTSGSEVSPSPGLAAASLASSVTPTTTSSNNQATGTTVSSSTASSVVTSTSPFSSTLSATRSSNTVLSSSSISSRSLSASPSVFTVVIGSQNSESTAVVVDNDNDKNEGESENDQGTHLHLIKHRSLKSKRTQDAIPSTINGTSTSTNTTATTATAEKIVADTDGFSDTCVKALIWPWQRLSDNKREDITFIAFQVWVLGMSIAALLNESIQHTVATLLMHLLATIWAIYQIVETQNFRQNFNRLITNGACNPNNLLGSSYWDERKSAEISSAVLNGLTLLIVAFLTYKLVELYGWQTFKRVGASLTINRIYKLVLSLSISIQLGLFFIVSAMALWIDQLMNGAIGRLAVLGKVYKAVFLVVFILLIPWLSLGWFSVRREKRKLCLVFLALSLIFIGLWAAMFKSDTFRWTFVTWTFFTVMASTAGILMITTFVLGVACRINFGKGLPRYLNAEEPIGEADFTSVYPEKHSSDDDPEKVEFPSYSRAVPTFSATFGRSPEVPKPTQMRFSPSQASNSDMYGDQSSQGFFQGHNVGRSISSVSSQSSKSSGSIARTNTRSSTLTGSSGRTERRWVIE